MERLLFPLSKKEAESANIGTSRLSDVNKNALFPTRLRELRKEKGVSQAVLAKEIGVTKSTIGLYETGDNVPDVKTLSKMAEYYCVSSDYLLCSTDNKTVIEDVKIASKTIGLPDNDIKKLKYYIKHFPAAAPVLSRMFCNVNFIVALHRVYKAATYRIWYDDWCVNNPLFENEEELRYDKLTPEEIEKSEEEYWEKTRSAREFKDGYVPIIAKDVAEMEMQRAESMVSETVKAVFDYYIETAKKLREEYGDKWQEKLM